MKQRNVKPPSLALLSCKNSKFALLLAAVLVPALIVTCELYRNRAQTQRNASSPADSHEYQREVRQRFAQGLERLRPDISDAVRAFWSKRTLAGGRIPPPVFTGRVAFITLSDVSDETNEVRMNLKPSGLDEMHFLLPRARRADTPSEVQVLVWRERTGEPTGAEVNGAPDSMITLQVYDRVTGIFWRSEKMPPSELEAFLRTLTTG